MLEGYVTINDAAQLEGISYKALQMKIRRNEEGFKLQTVPSENGGRDRVLVSVQSLSKKALKTYKASGIQNKNVEEEPWYVYADYAWYQTKYKEYFYKGVELARYVREYLEYKGKNKTEFAKELAKKCAISSRSFHDKVKFYVEASAWAIKLEHETGENHDFIKVMAVCRKPREEDTFPSLTEELQAYIDNIYYDEDFARNNQTITNLYDDLQEVADMKGLEIPSYDTVWRYIKATQDEDGEGARDLVAKGLRYWKNKHRSKKYRDTGRLKVLEVLQGDVHTFDCWVAVKRSNGKMQAIKPCLVAWLDTRSRALVGWKIAENPDAQIIKESLINAFYPKKNEQLPYGVAKYLLIDNGKEYTAETLTGRPRTVRFTFDNEIKGFYRSLGIEDDMRSLPYQPWSKAEIERFYGTVCTKFSKRMKSYTGTLTGSKTSAKVQKNIQKMLENGELMSIETFANLFEEWVVEKYHKRKHRGLMRQGEECPAPLDVFQKAERHYKPAPPLDYALSLLMKSETRKVSNASIQITFEGNKVLYQHELLHKYNGKQVGFRYYPEDITKVFVYDEDGKKICEAVSYELLRIAPKVSDKAFVDHVKFQNKELKNEREIIKRRQMTYEEREEAKRTRLENAGKKKAGPELKSTSQKIVAIPDDQQYKDEVASKKTKTNRKKPKNEYYDKQAERGIEEILQRRKLG